jgi:DNA-binding MarR family transcriptional regulator
MAETPRTEDHSALAGELGTQLIRFARMVNQIKSRIGTCDGIERAGYAILLCLIHHGPQRTSALAESLRSDTSTVSRQSSALVHKGWVERRTDAEDGRASVLAPTAEGLRVFDEARAQRNCWLDDVLVDWPEHDRRTFTELFERFNNALEAHPPRRADEATEQHHR